VWKDSLGEERYISASSVLDSKFHLEKVLIKTVLLWGLESKEQSTLRESWDTESDWEAVVRGGCREGEGLMWAC
jgi:hypothetical protein